MVRITDKRFQQINLPSDVIDTKNGKIYHTLSGNDGYGLCNLLNELHEENEELKKENKRLRDFEYFVFKSIGELNEKKARERKNDCETI